MLFTQLIMSSSNLFHRSRALGKKEYWCAEVLAQREWSPLCSDIGASGNSVIFLMIMILNKWQSLICIRLIFNEGIFNGSYNIITWVHWKKYDALIGHARMQTYTYLVTWLPGSAWYCIICNIAMLIIPMQSRWSHHWSDTSCNFYHINF